GSEAGSRPPARRRSGVAHLGPARRSGDPAKVRQLAERTRRCRRSLHSEVVMGAQSVAAVAWQLERTSLAIRWDRGDEPVEWIADRLGFFVTGLSELLSIDGW